MWWIFILKSGESGTETRCFHFLALARVEWNTTVTAISLWWDASCGIHNKLVNIIDTTVNGISQIHPVDMTDLIQKWEHENVLIFQDINNIFILFVLPTALLCCSLEWGTAGFCAWSFSISKCVQSVRSNNLQFVGLNLKLCEFTVKIAS